MFCLHNVRIFLFLLQKKNDRSLNVENLWEYPVSWTSITILFLILFVFVAVLPRIDDKPLLAHKQIVWKYVYVCVCVCVCVRDTTHQTNKHIFLVFFKKQTKNRNITANPFLNVFLSNKQTNQKKHKLTENFVTENGSRHLWAKKE